MTLTREDKTYIDRTVREIVRDTVVEVLERLILPRLDAHDKRFEVIEADVRELRNDMRQVKSTLVSIDGRVEALENDVKELYLMKAV